MSDPLARTSKSHSVVDSASGDMFSSPATTIFGAGHIGRVSPYESERRQASLEYRKGGRMFRKLCALAAVLALTSVTAVGCISDHTYGCENTTVVAAGSPEGEIYTQHGCPDQIIEVGNAVGPNIKHWNKYLVVYRIAEGHKLLGTIMQSDRFSNIAYLVENGKVVNGGYVGEGNGSTILMALAGAMHNRVRAGYGGDEGWDGSYGESGRRGNY